MLTTRSDGLTYPTFYVCQLFDKEGYHSFVVADTREQVIQKASKRSEIKGMLACTLPFQGCWVSGLGSLVPDVSIPESWKKDLAHLNKEAEE